MVALQQGDHERAIKLFRDAAQSGDIHAAYTLGSLYGEGRVVTRDDFEAARWLRVAAEGGLRSAQNNLGVYYDRGWGVHQSSVEAVKWYRRAAEQGYGEAQVNLADKIVAGDGDTTRDYVEAHKWYNLAVAFLDDSQYEERDAARRARDRLANEMTPEQIAEAQRRYRDWKPKPER